MSSVIIYDYPRIEGAAKAYYMRLAQDEKSRELVTELLVPRRRHQTHWLSLLVCE